MATRKESPGFELKTFLAKTGEGRTVAAFRKSQTLFSQGDVANSVFYILEGKVKLTVVSTQGKEAVVAMLGAYAFLGEGCLAGQRHRMATATAMTDGSILTVEKETVVHLLHDEPTFSELFTSYLLVHNIRVEEDLVDQLFNSSEKRLARILLLMSRVGKTDEETTVVPKISQEVLAEMIGTTRERVNFFMNKFRRLGLIEYRSGLDGLRIFSSLVNVVLFDKSPQSRPAD